MNEDRLFQYEKAANFIVIAVSWVMSLILSVGFMIEFLKGTRSLGFVLPILSIDIISVIAGTVLYTRNPLSRAVRYVTFIGFYIMYLFTLMTATTDVTFTFVFPLATLFCIYLDRWFISIVCTLVLLLNGVYIVEKLMMVDKRDIGITAYNQFTTTIMIHVFVLLLFMSSSLAIVYIFSRLKQTMDNKIQEAKDARLTEQTLVFQATIDGLTGLFNRRHFLDKVQGQLDVTGAASCLLLLDIDDFKQVNDTYGHIAGDHVLIEFSSILKMIFAEKGIVGRVGGEEFAVFLNEISEEESCEVAEFLRATIQESLIPLQEQKQIHITISGGIAYSNKNAVKFEELYQQADVALYQSKASGKNRITLAEQLQ